MVPCCSPPPFYDLLAASVDRATGEIDDKGMSVTKPGYVGQMKGIKQYLWERGLYFSFKQNDLCKNDKCIREGKGCTMTLKVYKKDTHFRQHVFSMQHILGQCRDFANETSALQEKFRVLGHGLIMSPKGHPELAGKGIEFSWGISKKYFRSMPKKTSTGIHQNILKSFSVMDLRQSLKNSRRTRRYRNAYDNTDGSRDHKCHEDVEKFVRNHKCHRNILDQDTAEINKVLIEHGILFYK